MDLIFNFMEESLIINEYYFIKTNCNHATSNGFYINKIKTVKLLKIGANKPGSKLKVRVRLEIGSLFRKDPRAGHYSSVNVTEDYYVSAEQGYVFEIYTDILNVKAHVTRTISSPTFCLINGPYF